MRRLLMILPLLAVAACSSDENFTPPAPGPSIPTIGGTYSAPNMWQFDFTSPEGQDVFTCAGGVTIANQVGTTFSGTFFISDPSCGNLSGTVNAGSFDIDGAISFELVLGESNFLTAAFGCAYVSGDRLVTGTLVDRQLTAEARTVMNCNVGQASLFLRLSGAR